MATIVEGDRKTPFSIATTPWCRGRRYFIPWIATLYPWCIPYNAEYLARWDQVPFLSCWYDSTWDWNLISQIFGEHSIHYTNNRAINLMSSMFANGPGDRGSILGRVIPKIQKWYLIPRCLTLSILRYVSRV